MDATLAPEEKRILLHVAREAIVRTLQLMPLPPLKPGLLPERLREPGASFITLTRVGQLRGCVGSVDVRVPLAADVREHSIAAAFRDFRFPPLRLEELEDLEVEVSVVMGLKPLPYDGPDDLLRSLRPGMDGVILTDGPRHATFLPKVWQKAPEAADFLSLLCTKMGARPQAWRAGRLQVQVYEVEDFSERGLALISVVAT